MIPIRLLDARNENDSDWDGRQPARKTHALMMLLTEIRESYSGIWSHSPEGRAYLARIDAALRGLEEKR